jgi:hypothetical protein
MAGGLPTWVVAVVAVVGGVAVVGVAAAWCAAWCAGARRRRPTTDPAAPSPVAPTAVVDLLVETRAALAALPWDHLEACRPSGIWCFAPPRLGPPEVLLWQGGSVQQARAVLGRAVLRAVARAADPAIACVPDVRVSLVAWPSRGCVVAVVDVGPAAALPRQPPQFTWLPWGSMRWGLAPEPLMDVGAPTADVPLVVMAYRDWARAMAVFRHAGVPALWAPAPTIAVPWTPGDAGAGTLAQGRALRAQGHGGPMVVTRVPADVGRHALRVAGFDGVVFGDGAHAAQPR